MAKKKELTPEELEQQADALLAAAEAEEKEASAKSSKKSGKKTAAAEPEVPHVMTDDEGYLRGDIVKALSDMGEAGEADVP